MSRSDRFSWFNRSGGRKTHRARRQDKSLAASSRKLGCEQLEDRRMLSVSVDGMRNLLQDDLQAIEYVTVVTHGFQLGEDGDALRDLSDAIRSNSQLVYDAAEFAGTAPARSAWVLDYDTDLEGTPSFDTDFVTGFTIPEASDGLVNHVILQFDWADDSRESSAGWTEAAGDSLFSLMTHLGLVDLESPSANPSFHFIGHSFGAAVTSEAIERLGLYNVTVDHVTYLDPHDYNQGLAFDAQQEQFTVGLPQPPTGADPQAGYGASVWNNVDFADVYYQTRNENGSAVPDALVPGGRPVPGAWNRVLDSELPGSGSYPALDAPGDHGYVWSGFYLATLPGQTASLPPQQEVDYASTGYGYSPFAQATLQDPPVRPPSGNFFDSSQDHQWTSPLLVDGQGNPAILLPGETEASINAARWQPTARSPVFNGDFAFAGDRLENQIPGWSGHSGNGDGKLITDLGTGEQYLRLDGSEGIDAARRTHNRTLVPENTVALKLDIRDIRGGGVSSDDHLVLYVNGVPQDPIPLQDFSSNWARNVSLPLPPSTQGKAVTLGIGVIPVAGGFQSIVDLDNVTLVVQPPPTPNEIVNTLNSGLPLLEQLPGASLGADLPLLEDSFAELTKATEHFDSLFGQPLSTPADLQDISNQLTSLSPGFTVEYLDVIPDSNGDLLRVNYQGEFGGGVLEAFLDTAAFEYLDVNVDGDLGSISAALQQGTIDITFGVDVDENNELAFFVSESSSISLGGENSPAFSVDGSISTNLGIRNLLNVDVTGDIDGGLHGAVTYADNDADNKLRLDQVLDTVYLTADFGGSLTFSPLFEAKLPIIGQIPWRGTFGFELDDGQINTIADIGEPEVDVAALLQSGFQSIVGAFDLFGGLNLDLNVPGVGQSLGETLGLPAFLTGGALGNTGFRLNPDMDGAIEKLINGDPVDLITFSSSGGDRYSDGFKVLLAAAAVPIGPIPLTAKIFWETEVFAGWNYYVGFGIDTSGFYIDPGTMFGAAGGVQSGLNATVSLLGLLGASVSAGVGASVGVTANVNDPNPRDGRIYLDELVRHESEDQVPFADALLSSFEVTVGAEAFAYARAVVSLLFFEWEVFNERTTLVEFGAELGGSARSFEDQENLEQFDRSQRTISGRSPLIDNGTPAGLSLVNGQLRIDTRLDEHNGRSNSVSVNRRETDGWIVVEWRGEGKAEYAPGAVSSILYHGNNFRDTLYVDEGIVGPGGAPLTVEAYGNNLPLGQRVTESDKVLANGDPNPDFSDDNNFRIESGIATVTGWVGNDVIRLGDAGGVVDAGAGDDMLIGGDGVDIFTGGAGNDRLEGRGGEDELDGGAGLDILIGGAARDILRGGSEDDLIYGGAGNDDLHGDGGRDFLYGEGNNDNLWGGSEDDVLVGGLGSDVLLGGTGNDTLFGDNGYTGDATSDGDDFLYGEEGDDQLFGEGGDDVLLGDGTFTVGERPTRDDIPAFVNYEADTAGEDWLVGDAGEDLLFGGGKNDLLLGGADADQLSGGSGEDILNGSGGQDELFGDNDDDTLQIDFASADGTIDQLRGNAGRDMLAIIGRSETVVDDGEPTLKTDFDDELRIGRSQDSGMPNRFFAESRDLETSDPPTRIEFDFSTGLNNDIELIGLQGLDGDDNLSVEDPVEDDQGNRIGWEYVLDGGPGNDFLIGGPGDDVLRGGPGNDRIEARGGDDSLFGDEGDDELFGEGGRDYVSTGPGGDFVVGGGGEPELIVGGDDNDILVADNGIFGATIEGGPGDDILIGSQGADIIRGGVGDDIIFGLGSGDTIIGGPPTAAESDADVLVGGLGKDVVIGGADDDSLYAHEHRELLATVLEQNPQIPRSLSTAYNEQELLDLVSQLDQRVADLNQSKQDLVLRQQELQQRRQDILDGVIVVDDPELEVDIITGDLDVIAAELAAIPESLEILAVKRRHLLGEPTNQNDRLLGDDGDDSLYGSPYRDELFGFDGNDNFYAGVEFGARYQANDIINGDLATPGDWVDTQWFDATPLDDEIFVAPFRPTTNEPFHAAFALGSPDNIVGFIDIDRDNVERVGIRAGDGDDTVLINYSDPASPQLQLDLGDVIVDAGAGDDTVDASAIVSASIEVHGGLGDDTITGGNEQVLGDSSGDAQKIDRLYGGLGDDVIRGGRGPDLLDGGAGNDLLEGAQGADELFGGEGNDQLYGGFSRDWFIDLNPDPNSLYGGPGDDSLFGGGAADYLVPGAGDDFISNGGSGAGPSDIAVRSSFPSRLAPLDLVNGGGGSITNVYQALDAPDVPTASPIVGGVASINSREYYLLSTERSTGTVKVGRVAAAEGQLEEFTLATGSIGRGIVAIPGGGFAVLWSEQGGAGNLSIAVYGQDGEVVASPASVNDGVVETSSRPSLALNADGNYIVAWVSRLPNNLRQAVWKRFSADLGDSSSENAISPGGPMWQFSPSVATHADGAFAIAWTEGANLATDSVYVQTYTAVYAPQGQRQLLSSASGFKSNVSLTALPNGGYYAVWESGQGSGLETDITGRFTSGSGVPTSSSHRVNLTSANDQRAPSVAALPNGDVAVAWSDRSPSGDFNDRVVAQIIGDLGIYIGGEIVLKAPNGLNTVGVFVSAAPQAGNAIVGWSDTRFTFSSQEYDSGVGILDSEPPYLVTTQAGSTQGVTLQFSEAIQFEEGQWRLEEASLGQDVPIQEIAYGLDETSGLSTVTFEHEMLRAGTYRISYDGQLTDLFGRGVDVDWDGTEDGVFAYEFQVSARPLRLGGRGTPDALASGMDGIAAAMHPTGDFYASAWVADESSPNASELVVQLFNNDGAERSLATVAYVDITGIQSQPSFSVAASGNFILTWNREDEGTGEHTVWARVFDSSLAPLNGMSEFRVDTAGSNSATRPAVASAPDGRFVVTWQSDVESDPNASGYDVYAREFSLDGTEPGDPILVNASSTAGIEWTPSVAADNTGYTVSWTSVSASGSSVHAAHHPWGGDGTAFFSSGGGTLASDQARVAMATDGEFAIVWRQTNADGSVILAQRFDDQRRPLGEALHVSPEDGGDHGLPDISIDDDGNLTFIWATTGGPDGDGYLTRWYDKWGNLLNEEVSIASIAATETDSTTSFGFFSDPIPATAVQGDGKIVVASARDLGQGNGGDFLIARLMPDGTPDPTFGTGGETIVDINGLGGVDFASQVIVDSTGRVIVSGQTTVQVGASQDTGVALVRLTSDGVLDPDFGSGGVVYLQGDTFTVSSGPTATSVNHLSLQDDGGVEKIVVGGGSFDFSTGVQNDVLLARFLPNGSLDSTFGYSGDTANSAGFTRRSFSDVTDGVRGLVVLPDGRIAITGIANPAATPPSNPPDDTFVAVFSKDGRFESQFGDGDNALDALLGGGSHNGSRLLTFPTPSGDKLLVLGRPGNSTIRLAALNTDATVFTDFGDGGAVDTGFIQSITGFIDRQGRIVVAGATSNENGDQVITLARYDSDGNLDPFFGGGSVTPGRVVIPELADPNEVAPISLFESASGDIVLIGALGSGDDRFFLHTYQVPELAGVLPYAIDTSPEGEAVVAWQGQGGEGANEMRALIYTLRPPTVENAAIDVEAIMSQAEPDEIEGYRHAITIGFSQEMATTGAGSVLETPNWSLRLADGRYLVQDDPSIPGVDPLATDEQWADISAPVLDPETGEWQVTLLLNAVLPAGDYELIARRTIEDASGRRLDGDRSGANADDLSAEFTVLAGDYDGNSTVDTDDYNLWRQSFGATSGPALLADGNQDGVVNAADYTVWRDNRGATAPAIDVHAESAFGDTGLDISQLGFGGEAFSLDSEDGIRGADLLAQQRLVASTPPATVSDVTEPGPTFETRASIAAVDEAFGVAGDRDSLDYQLASDFGLLAVLSPDSSRPQFRQSGRTGLAGIDNGSRSESNAGQEALLTQLAERRGASEGRSEAGLKRQNREPDSGTDDTGDLDWRLGIDALFGDDGTVSESLEKSRHGSLAARKRI